MLYVTIACGHNERKAKFDEKLMEDMESYNKSLIELRKIKRDIDVKIPIPENFEGKDLIAYYVKDNGNPCGFPLNYL